MRDVVEDSFAALVASPECLRDAAAGWSIGIENARAIRDNAEKAVQIIERNIETGATMADKVDKLISGLGPSPSYDQAKTDSDEAVDFERYLRTLERCADLHEKILRSTLHIARIQQAMVGDTSKVVNPTLVKLMPRALQAQSDNRGIRRARDVTRRVHGVESLRQEIVLSPEGSGDASDASGDAGNS